MNRDNSINIYLDAMTREMKFTLRELDEEDLKRREARPGDAMSPARTAAPPLIPPASADDNLPPGLA